MNDIITQISDAIWGYVLIAYLIACGVWFTWKTKGVQFRMLGEMFRLLTDAATTDSTSVTGGSSTADSAAITGGSSTTDSAAVTGGSSTADSPSGEAGGRQKHISSFQAFAVSVATRVGTGNLAGVATAIAIGGPGAIFWMWVMALFGAATSFVESTLGQLFKQRQKDSYIGGPAYYILRGLHLRWMAYLSAVLLVVTFGIVYNSIQSNTICGAMQSAFGWDPLVVGYVLAAMGLLIVFGGIHRIAHVSSVLVPIMAIGYFLLAAYVVLTNIGLIPHVLKVVVTSAFGWEQGVGGALGATIMMGVKRGLFSNEAGEGSVPNVAATASVSHPVKQGLIQALGVFTDTLLVCSCTAFVILISGLYEVPELNGVALTQAALGSEIGASGPTFIAVAIFLFAFSSIIGNYYYGEANIRFISLQAQLSTRSSWCLISVYRILSAGAVVVFGATVTLDVVWNLGDLFMAMVTGCNLIAISILGKYVFRLLDDYRAQQRRGIKEPTFHRGQLPEIEHDIDCWE